MRIRRISRFRETKQNIQLIMRMPRLVGAFAFFTDCDEIRREPLIWAGFCDILQVLTEPVKIDLKNFLKNLQISK